MAKQSSNQLLAVGAMFLSGSVQKMKDIQELSPTAIAKGLGLNHSRYIEKLYKPEGFTIKHIIKLANLIDVDPHIILNVITKQLSPSIKITGRIS